MESRKSILHILQTPLDFMGGPATYVKEISKQLSMNGIKVGIIAPAPSKQSEEVYMLRNKYKVDLHFIKTSLLNHLIRTPFIYSLKAHKVIAHVVRDYDIINVHVEATLLQSFISLFDNKKLLLTVHGIYPFEDLEILKHYPLNLYRLIHLIAVSPQHMLSLKRISAKSRYVIPVSKFLAKLLISHYRISKEKVIVIPNSVDVDAFKPKPFSKSLELVNKVLVLRGSKSLIDNEKIILFASRLEPGKGLHVLIKSLCMLDNKSWSLVIAGSGAIQYVRKCLDLARKHNKSNQVHFIGRVSKFFLKHLYSSAYVYVLPSLFEGLPASVLEAMACGTPVIASKVGDLPEVVKHGETGLLINKPDPNELAKTLELILTDEGLRKRLSINGLNHVRKQYSWQINAKKYMELALGETI